MERIFFRWIALSFIAVVWSCSRAPDETGIAASEEVKTSEPEKAVTFSAPDDLSTRFEDGDEKSAAEAVSPTEIAEEKPPSPEHIRGREQTMAEDILAMPEGEAQALALTELIRRWSVTDPEAALAFREKIESEYGKHSDVRRAYYRGIAEEMAKAEPSQLLDVIDDGLWWNGQWRPQREALNRVAAIDFDRAVEHFLGTDEGKQHREESYLFARRLAAEKSVGEALEFAEAMKRPLSKGHALRGAIIEWAAQDVEAATQYINGIDDDYLRSLAVDGLIGEIWKTNPGESIEWALSITEPEVRSETLRKLAGVWDNDGSRGNLESLLGDERLSGAERQAIKARLSSNSTTR